MAGPSSDGWSQDERPRAGLVGAPDIAGEETVAGRFAGFEGQFDKTFQRGAKGDIPEVVVRSITTGEGHTEYTPIGHTTNLASRMQALAPTGSIAISEQTRKFVEGYFQLKALGPTRVKGVSEQVNVYEVTGLGPLRSRLERAAGRGFTKFVGRQLEMDAMKAAAEQYFDLIFSLMWRRHL